MTKINHPALLQAENEKLRGLLSEVAHCLRTSDEQPLYWEEEFASRIYRALSQKAEHTDTFTAVDMATAAAQGFRDGQAAVEQAAAQDEREAKAWPALAGIGRDSGHPRAVVLYLRHEPSDEHLRMIQEALRTRPAQTEQQPVAWQHKKPTVNDSGEIVGYSTWTNGKGLDWWPHRPLYAAPIAQTAPQQSDDSLIANAKALLALDERGSLAPHGIGGLAREVIEKLVARVEQTAPQPVEVMRFQLKHPDTGDAHAVALTRQEVADGMEDTLYEKLGDLICHCEPVGETNVVDCNCDEYIYEFELVNAAPIAQTSLPTQGAVEQ